MLGSQAEQLPVGLRLSGRRLPADTPELAPGRFIAPRLAYLTTLLLCAVEAKRDDFERGRAQCLAEMVACRDNNRRESRDTDAVFGIVSNGQVWQFYKLARTGEVHESDLLAMSDLPRLLGALDFVCAECARQVPETPGTPAG